MNRSLTFLLHRRHRPAWRWLLAALVLIVAWFAFSPSEGMDAFQHVDKVKHVLAFGCMATVASLGWHATLSTRGRIALSLLLYGVFIELVQSTIPGRSASGLDVMADAAGIVAGQLTVHLARLRLDRLEA